MSIEFREQGSQIGESSGFADADTPLDSTASPCTTTRSAAARRNLGRTLRPVRALLIALALILALGAAGAASAGAAPVNGDLIVTKGGDRTATNTAQGDPSYAAHLAGARFEYTQDDPTLPATVWTQFTNLTDANGQATENLPEGIYYVREKTAAPEFTNFGPLQSVSHSGPQPYVARVEVQSGLTTYAYPHTNTNADPANWTPTNTGTDGSNDGSPFLDVRDNGTSPEVCGVNYLLVLDRSGSIFAYKDDYKAAAKAFVDNFKDTPTQIGIISFNTTVNSYSPAVGNANFYNAPLDLSVAGSAATLNATIDNIYDNPDNLTNWDGVLNAASQAKGFTPNAITGQTANPDQVVFITDGNPTTDDVTDTSSGLIDLTSGIASANKVKSQPGRGSNKLKMLAIGVDNQAGSAPTAANLKVVSGPVEGVEGDYATPTISVLDAFLAELAATECGARVYVRKHLENDNTNQPDWFYTAIDPRPGSSPSYLDNDRSTHDNGGVIETAAFFTALPETPTTVEVNEDANGQPLAAGTFSLTDVDCRYDSYSGDPVPGGVQSGLDYSVPVNRGDEVYCTYTNAPDTTLSVAKTGNGNIKAGEDVEFTIQVTNTGPNTATDVTLNDQLPSGTAGGWQIASQPAAGTCSISGSTLSCSFGDLAAGASVTVGIKAPTGVNNCTTYDNTATASSTNAPDASGNDTVTCTKIKPDIVLKKKANKKTVRPGDKVKYTVTVKNTKKGSVAKNLKVCDKLPSKMTVVKKGKKAYFDNGKLCWNVKKLPYSKNGKSFKYTAKVNNGVNPGTKLKNVATVGNKKATKTVRVKKPKVINRPKRVPVTG